MWLGSDACESEIESLSNKGIMGCLERRGIMLMFVRGRASQGNRILMFIRLRHLGSICCLLTNVGNDKLMFIQHLYNRYFNSVSGLW